MPLVKELCDGCIKANIKEDRCITYGYPENWHRMGGCPLKSNKALEVMVTKKVNPLKASRRKRRGR